METPAFFPVNKSDGNLFLLHTHSAFKASFLDLWLLISSLDQCGYHILDSTFIGFHPIDCTVFDCSAEPIITMPCHWIPMHSALSVSNDRWLVWTCDPKRMSAEDGNRMPSLRCYYFTIGNHFFYWTSLGFSKSKMQVWATFCWWDLYSWEKPSHEDTLMWEDLASYYLDNLLKVNPYVFFAIYAVTNMSKLIFLKTG